MMTRSFAIALTFACSVLGSALFAAAYAANWGPHLEGLGLFVSLAGLAAGTIGWALGAIAQEQVVDRRDDYPSDPAARAAAQAALERGIDELDRHGFLLKCLFGAFGALGLAALFPLRSLGPNFGTGLYKTKWRKGARLVLEDGTPVRVSDLAVGSMMTVFPDGYVGDASSQTVLLRLPPGTIQASEDRRTWTPHGYAAFSKVCTHAGCPVGLYLASKHELLCPCHQSVFDVVAQAKPISGPAARPLPQLPLEIADDGYLQAQSDYTEPIGPGFWQRS
ncbi:MAG TPA: Rieske (2Fe-2S) protein [Candidatus Tumulicola sp.]|jgi:ubiquinol-cytochrome c reductase iron-sulfur subunit